MRWWSLRRRRGPSPALDKAKVAATKRELERVRAQWPAVLRYAAAMVEHRERNGFSEAIANIYRGGRA